MAVAAARNYGLFIDGEAAEPVSGEVRSLVEPATGEPLANAAMAGEADVDRAVEAARANPLVDPKRVAVNGGSQGGGLALAAAGLVPDLLLTLTDVPFMCHWRRATEIIDTDPYHEVVRYCKIHRELTDRVFRTLSYHDGVNFAARAKSPALFSVALMDDICPPSTVFAAYNHYAGPKEIEVYPFNGHENGESIQAELKMRRLAVAARG